MSGFQFGKIPPSSTSPFSFATSSSSSPSPPPFSYASPFGSSQPSTNPNSTFGAPTVPSFGFGFANTSLSFSAALAPPAMSSVFGFSPAPASSTLFGSSAAGNATSSSPLGGSTLFGSSSRTDPLSNLFGSSSVPTNSLNLFGTSSVSVNTSKLLGANSGSGNVSGLFSSSKAPAAGSTSVFGSNSGSDITSSLFVSSSGSSNTSSLFGSSSAAGSASSLFGSTANLFSASSGYGTSSTGSGNASNLFVSTSGFGNSSSLFGATSSNAVSASTSTSFPDLFGTPTMSISTSSSIKPSSSSLTPVFSLPCTLSSNSTASGFTIPGVGSSSGLTNGGFTFSTTSTFSGFTASTLSSSTVVSSGSFLFGTPLTSRSQSCCAAPVVAVSNSKLSSIGFGTDSSPLFSTVTTTPDASTQATTTATTLSATPIPGIPAFGMTSSTDGKDALVAATESFPCFVTSSSAATSGTTSSVSGFLLSTETAGIAAPLQPHTSVASTLCRIPVWQGEAFSRVGGSSWCSSALQKVDLNKEKEVNLGLSEGEIKQLKDIIRLINIRMAEYQDKEICMGPLEGSKTHDIKVKVSEVKDGIESQLLLTVGQLPMVPHMKFLEGPGDTLPSEKLAAVERGLKSPHKEIFEGPSFFSSQLTNDNMFTWSSRNDLIIKQILDKYGDITSGSILKSTAAKSTFLSLVADVVERLCNHTLDTLDADELQLMEMQIADAAAVGFYVDWLRQRVEKIISASKYKLHVKQLDELDKLIFAAKRSLMEMELQQLILKKEISALKVEMQGDGLSESNLVEGLL